MSPSRSSTRNSVNVSYADFLGVCTILVLCQSLRAVHPWPGLFVCLVPVSTTWCVLRLRMEERPPDVESSYVDTKICFLAQLNTVNISISQLPASLQLTFNSEELTPLQGYSHVIDLWVCMYVCMYVCVYIYIYKIPSLIKILCFIGTLVYYSLLQPLKFLLSQSPGLMT